ncbi:hypothetical protein EYC84_004293 [Monilinia fructicola]|uniref:Uncharacterized protein n=1 Tax=Monilinia fructicola TaxID=38448 RepID=A0A5M9K4J0_MONFR|nr:hypothetical protein EYC84_004293 [Monilinia fructicola]
MYCSPGLPRPSLLVLLEQEQEQEQEREDDMDIYLYIKTHINKSEHVPQVTHAQEGKRHYEMVYPREDAA